MQLIRNPAARVSPSAGTVAALSDFDGFHLGHQRLVAKAVERARRERVAASAIVLGSRGCGGRLSTLRQKVRLLDEGSIEWVVLPRPGASAQRLAELLRPLRIRVAVVARGVPGGENGDDAAPERVARSLGLQVETVPAVLVDGSEVSSDAVRRALLDGDLDGVERMLGRPYATSGHVVHGHHRGKGLGIPTANLLPRDMALPPDGVYAVRASVAGRELAGVANVGRKPTFGDPERTIEVHLLDFDDDIYGRRLEAAFVARLRAEVRFPGVEALVAQIRADIARARLLLAR